MINTVKLQNTGWLVNNNKSVPNDPRNTDYQAVQRWLDGRTDDWLALEEAFNQETEAHENFIDITTYEARLAQYEIDVVAYAEWDGEGNKPSEPVFPVKPEGYYTVDEVTMSQIEHDAWLDLQASFVSVEGSTFNIPEPEIKKRPIDLVEPTITPLVALVPNTPEPEDPPPPPQTLDEVYDQAIQNSKVLKAVILALNDGTFVPGSNYTNAQIKNRIKGKI